MKKIFYLLLLFSNSIFSQHLGELIGGSTNNLVYYFHAENNSSSDGMSTTLSNGGTVNNSASRFKKGFDFGTTNTNKILYNNIFNNQINGNNVTLMAWVNLSSTANTQQMVMQVACQSPYNVTYGILWVSGYFDFFRTDSSSNYLGSNLASNTVNKWVSVIGVFNGSLMSIYINGSLTNSTTITAGHNTTALSSRITIGSAGSVGAVIQPLTGLIDEVIVFKEAKSAQWISRYYAQAMGRFQTQQ